MAIPKLVTNWTISIDGLSYLGKCSSLELPTVKEVTQEVWGCGYAAKQKAVMGYEPLEAKFTFLEIDATLFNLFGLSHDGVAVICKASLGGGDKPTPLLAVLHGRFHEIGLGAFKMGETSEMTCTMEVKRYALTIGNRPALVIDVENNVMNLNGLDDVLTSTKKALGL